MRTASNQYRARKCHHWPRVAMWVTCLAMGALVAPIDRARAAAPATGPAVEAQRRVMDRVQRVLVHVAGSHSDSSNPVWVVAFDQKPSQPPSTRVLMREQFGDPKWRGLSRIAARPLGITSHKGELVLFLALGDEPSRRAWAWFSPSSDGRAERFTYGPKLPSEATILTLAGDANNLWALGRSEPGAATTAPSRRDATTLPSTRRAGESAGLLYLLNGSEWIPQPAPLPEPVTSDLRGVSMAVIDSRPVVALASSDATVVRLYEYARQERTWKLLQTLNLKGGPTQMLKVVNVAGKPGVWVWVDTAAGLGEIWTTEEQRVPLGFPGPVLSPGDVDLTVSEQVLTSYRTPDGKVFTQRYDLKGGALAGTAQELTWNEPRRAEMNWITISVMAVLTALILSTLMRRRAATRDERADPDD